LPAEKRQILAYCMHLRDKLLEALSAVWSAAHASRKTRVISAAALGLTLIAFGAAGVAPLAPDASDLPVKQLIEELALPDLSEQIARLSPASQQFVAEERVRAGDTLATLLERLGVNDPLAAAFIKSDPAARALLHLRPGRRVQASIATDGLLLSASALVAEGKDDPKKLVIARTNNGFAANLTDVVLERRPEMRSGEIRSSLFAATDAAQIPDAVAMQIVEIFSADIDFASDLRRGDRFNVVYETVWLGGEFVRAGRVLAAEFHNDGKTRQAVWFDNPASKENGYFDLHGKSLKKAFLKSPLQFSRVTSGFAMRVHPVSGQWKQHKGIDFAAATGTPIRAAGDGVIDFAGAQGGYGNVVVIQHGAVYSTAYAHMSRMAPGMRRGTRVSQGEVIGYVGTTGWSTGPHLHYEFRVNDHARDPASIVVPHTQALAGHDLQRFRTVAGDMAHRFALLSPQSTQVAAR
jgi:murein DD-endopeptidase MepM/ murein hydrolase activator NlpD